MGLPERCMIHIRPDTQLPDFYMCPKYMMNCSLTLTAMKLYILLFDRAKLSMKNNGWTDDSGDTYIYYSRSDLADEIGCSQRMVRNAMHELEKMELIQRIPDARKELSNAIYVCIPDEKIDSSITRKPVSEGGNTFPPGRKYISSQAETHFLPGGSTFPPSNNNRVIINQSNNRVRDTRHAYGEFRNIILTEEEYARLSGQFRNLQQIIDKMSTYLAKTGKHYDNYEAAILSWAEREPEAYAMRKYTCREGESL